MSAVRYGESKSMDWSSRVGAQSSDSLDGLCSLLEQVEDLVKLGSEQVEGRQDPSVRSEVVPARSGGGRRRREANVSFGSSSPSSELPTSEFPLSSWTRMYLLLHDLLVIYCISDVDVCVEGHVGHCWVEVDNVGRRLLRVQVRVQSLHQRSLARTSHP